MKMFITNVLHIKFLFVFVVLSLGTSLSVVPLNLKAATKITYGQTVEETISKPFESDRFTFNGTANNIITILAARSAGSLLFSPTVKVLRPDGTLLKEVSSDPTNPSARIDNLTLPSTGVYTIVLLDGFSRIETGTYGLTLQRLKPPFGTHINYGTITKDSIEIAGDINAYTFNGTANNIINIRATRIDGSLLFSPKIEVYKPNGSLLQTATSNPTFPVARISNLKVPATGIYTILLLDGFNRIQTGTYKLVLTRNSSLTDNFKNEMDDKQLITMKDKKIETNFKIIVTPNPSNQQFKVLLNGLNLKDKITIRVYDANGRLVEEKNSLYNNQTIIIGDKYAKGVYFIETVQNQVRKTQKIIKL